MTDPFAPLARALADRAVRYLLIGVSGANYYAVPPAGRFVTDDYEGVEIPTARLLHNVTSKRAAGRPKDQLFLATHQNHRGGCRFA